jgi:hypothetical protein
MSDLRILSPLGDVTRLSPPQVDIKLLGVSLHVDAHSAPHYSDA